MGLHCMSKDAANDALRVPADKISLDTSRRIFLDWRTLFQKGLFHYTQENSGRE